MKPKIGIVIQRYGAEVLGGAEKLASQVVEAIKDDYRITVITTTAIDYISWANHYEVGTTIEEGVEITRFPVIKERKIDDFNKINESFFSKSSKSAAEEDEWFKIQGPDCPNLVAFLRKNEPEFDCFVFFTYLYYPTIFGLPAVALKSIMVPTAHDEPPFYLNKVKAVLKSAQGLIFNTGSEKELLYRIHPDSASRSVIAGTFIEPPEGLEKLPPPVSGQYCLYFGRLEKGKGLYDLFDYFQILRAYHPELLLVCLGGINPEIKSRGGIFFPGYVSELEKWAYIANCEFIVVPSPLESLSLTLLEGFAAGRPALVNAKSDVMVEHCRKSGAGLWYSDYTEFAASADYLLNSQNCRKKMGKNGALYVKNHYSREKFRKIYRDFIDSIIEIRDQ
jgi:glycosyltransferase involved in cell wall biosynthesis